MLVFVLLAFSSMQLCGKSQTGQTYKFRCQIVNFCIDANDFCKRLKDFRESASHFSKAISDFTDGNVQYIEGTAPKNICGNER